MATALDFLYAFLSTGGGRTIANSTAMAEKKNSTDGEKWSSLGLFLLSINWAHSELDPENCSVYIGKEKSVFSFFVLFNIFHSFDFEGLKKKF